MNSMLRNHRLNTSGLMSHAIVTLTEGIFPLPEIGESVETVANRVFVMDGHIIRNTEKLSLGIAQIWTDELDRCRFTGKIRLVEAMVSQLASMRDLQINDLGLIVRLTTTPIDQILQQDQPWDFLRGVAIRIVTEVEGVRAVSYDTSIDAVISRLLAT